MLSDFLIKFHREHFPDGGVPVYSKQIFYKLLEEVNKDE